MYNTNKKIVPRHLFDGLRDIETRAEILTDFLFHFFPVSLHTCTILHVVYLYRCILLFAFFSQVVLDRITICKLFFFLLQRRNCSLMKKEEIPNIVPKYLQFLAVWTKFETFYFHIFPKKRGNLLIRGKLSSLLLILQQSPH